MDVLQHVRQAVLLVKSEKAVRDLLIGSGLPKDRIRAEGRADADPVAANDSPPNRALNRRVEITLTALRADAGAARPAAPASATR